MLALTIVLVLILVFLYTRCEQRHYLVALVPATGANPQQFERTTPVRVRPRDIVAFRASPAGDRWIRSPVYPWPHMPGRSHDAVAVDRTGDGYDDVVVLDDRGIRVWRNMRNGTFRADTIADFTGARHAPASGGYRLLVTRVTPLVSETRYVRPAAPEVRYGARGPPRDERVDRVAVAQREWRARSLEYAMSSPAPPGRVHVLRFDRPVADVMRRAAAYEARYGDDGGNVATVRRGRARGDARARAVYAVSAPDELFAARYVALWDGRATAELQICPNGHDRLDGLSKSSGLDLDHLDGPNHHPDGDLDEERALALGGWIHGAPDQAEFHDHLLDFYLRRESSFGSGFRIQSETREIESGRFPSRPNDHGYGHSGRADRDSRDGRDDLNNPADPHGWTVVHGLRSAIGAQHCAIGIAVPRCPEFLYGTAEIRVGPRTELRSIEHGYIEVHPSCHKKSVSVSVTTTDGRRYTRMHLLPFRTYVLQ